MGHKYNIRRYLDFPIEEYEGRCRRAQTLLAERGFDALILTTGQNLRYFSGLNTVLYQTTLRPITMLIPADDRRGPVMVVPEVLDATCLATSWVDDVRINSECYGKTPTDVLQVLESTITSLGLSSARIGMEFGLGQYLSMEQGQLRALQDSLPGVRWEDASDIIWELRMVKSRREVEALQAACDISAKGIEAAYESLKPGMTERELYAVMTASYYKNGAEGHFLTFMSGAKGNQVRDGGASDLPFEKGHFAKIDGGAMYKGYYCDFCRLIGVGQLLDSQRRAIATSAAAGGAAIAAARPGVCISELAAAALGVLREAGYSCYMNAIGHGVGMAIHERPWVQGGSTIQLTPGMVLAIEVGVVDKERFDDGSYTTEENIAITEDGARVLTNYMPPDLLEVQA